MQVLKISSSNYNNNSNAKFKNIKNKSTSLQNSSHTNLISPNAYYSQVSFKCGKVGNTASEITAYMRETVKPFLDETEPFFQKAFNLSEKIGTAVREFNPKEIKFNPLEFKEVKRLRLDELHNNKQEYYYLLKKSDNFYSTKETNDYAWGLFDYFSTPEFLSEPYNAFRKMKTDTEHGLKNIKLEKLYPKLNEKVQNVYRTGSRSAMGMSGYTHAYIMNKNFDKLAEKGIVDIFEYKRLAQEAERGMEQHKKYLPEIEQAVCEAEKLYQNGLFTEADYDLLNSIPKRGQRVISRNAKKFNDVASKTQLNENESKQLDDVLKKQEELITDLWNKIEVDKKAYFERIAKEREILEAQAKAEEEKLRAIYGDDYILPF